MILNSELVCSYSKVGPVYSSVNSAGNPIQTNRLTRWWHLDQFLHPLSVVGSQVYTVGQISVQVGKEEFFKFCIPIQVKGPDADVFDGTEMLGLLEDEHSTVVLLHSNILFQNPLKFYVGL